MVKSVIGRKALTKTENARVPIVRALGVMLSKLFYQPLVDKEGNPISLRPFWGKLNRNLMENGYSPPWIMTRQECLYFWSSIPNSPEFSGNRPDEYAPKKIGIIKFLHEFWSPPVTREDHILELGCGSGANLYYLYQLGYTNPSGIEINKNFVDEMNKVFPELASQCKVSVGSLESVLPKLATDSVDVILTIAVAMHIHPTSNFLFEEMRRVARKYIMLIEPEVANCSYIFARNYRRLFHKLGSPQLKSMTITNKAFPEVSRDYDGYVARLFSTGKQRGLKY